MTPAKRLLALLLVIQLTPLDIFRINIRRNYYPPSVARFFQNKLAARFTLIRKAVYSYLRTDAF